MLKRPQSARIIWSANTYNNIIHSGGVADTFPLWRKAPIVVTTEECEENLPDTITQTNSL